MTCAALGHPGGSFSEAEFLAVLYNYALRFDAAEPEVADARRLLPLQVPRLPRPVRRAGAVRVFRRPRPEAIRRVGLPPGKPPGQPAHARHRDLRRLPRADSRRRRGPRARHPAPRAPIIPTGWSTSSSATASATKDRSGRRSWPPATTGSTTWSSSSTTTRCRRRDSCSQDMSIEPLADKLAAFNLDPRVVRNGHNVGRTGRPVQLAAHARPRPAHRGHPEHGQGEERRPVPVQPQLAHSAPRDAATAQALARGAVGAGRPAPRHPRGISPRPGGRIRIVPPLHEQSRPDHRAAGLRERLQAPWPNSRFRPGTRPARCATRWDTRSPTWRRNIHDIVALDARPAHQLRPAHLRALPSGQAGQSRHRRAEHDRHRRGP